ncbi:presenilin family intramembrane aspartyl protease PSH [Halalkalicoccus sp. NIPERK01]|uniref:presenilin family intramembrane aspartyl protease PSH n=1 Tax=Halalkalicoccus sp. NIPERK01 TaxID=3053469 RepID=UPI00256F2F19|nr:presenilin family intramembrane aspartyl protease PSH [Halalkalicoccus sp. NIPERK01]MDL5361103.1 presenilin family intramembrane aspartyl protease PSH [Halalkalicoccus sp. NIPERK01]
MEQRRLIVAVAGTVALFLTIQFGALALVEPFQSAGLQAVENPEDPTNSFLYIGAILVATGLMLAAFKFDLQWLIRGMVILASVLLSWYVLVVVVPPVLTVGDVHLLAALGALAIGAGLAVHPEWYVIDAAGVVMGAGAAGLFGITFGILPALVLLVVLAVYDAISVYGTKHMLSLADGVMEIKVPVLLIVPVSPDYSFLDEGESEASDGSTDGDDGEGRDAFFIGLGDAVIPTILIASAAFFVPAPSLEVPGVALTLPALGGIVGMLAGLLVLLWMVLQGRAHAGLPLLNGGTIAGYLLGALASGLTLTQAIGL